MNRARQTFIFIKYKISYNIFERNCDGRLQAKNDKHYCYMAYVLTRQLSTTHRNREALLDSLLKILKDVYGKAQYKK